MSIFLKKFAYTLLKIIFILTDKRSRKYNNNTITVFIQFYKYK